MLTIWAAPKVLLLGKLLVMFAELLFRLLLFPWWEEEFDEFPLVPKIVESFVDFSCFYAFVGDILFCMVDGSVELRCPIAVSRDSSCEFALPPPVRILAWDGTEGIW